jgi:phage tail sheath protein FI
MANSVSTEIQLSNTQLDSLNDGTNPINVIRYVPGNGIVVMGGRTILNSPGDRYINVRRSIIYLKKQLTDLSAFAIFENNDSHLWTQIRIVLNEFLRGYWQAGGLRGNSIDQAFYVQCDSTTTSAADILNGRVNINVGVAIEYPAEFVVISLGQLTGNAKA